MQVNWFTFIAQIVNFLILVALLKHFLYGRIIRAMDKRERTIASTIEGASAEREKAKEEFQKYLEEKKELDERREALLGEAEREADRKRRELTEAAREEVAKLSAGWKEALAKEKDSFLEDLRHRTAKQVYATARKALSDLADADLEERIILGFVRRIQKVDRKTRDEIAESLKGSENELVINSSFEIPDEQRQQLSRAIRENIADNAKLVFQRSPDIICGIEMRTRARKIAWSIADYLDVQQENFFSNLEETLKKKKETRKLKSEGKEDE